MLRGRAIAVAVCDVLAGCSGVPGGVGESQPTDGDDVGTEPPNTASQTPTDTQTATSASTPTDTPTQQDTPSDSDSLSYQREQELGTDPSERDTDGDGLKDGREVNKWETDPTEPDTDGDGIRDGKETFMDTSPTDADSDGDGIEDGREVELGTDPVSADTDEDGLTDGRELEIGTDPTDLDTDGDGRPDGQEVEEGTNPVKFTDDDGLNYQEEQELGTNHRQADTDNDNLTDDRELEVGTDPTDPDTDGDALLDGDEVQEEQGGVELPDADPLHKDIYVQEVVTPDGQALPEEQKKWLTDQYAQMTVQNPDGESGIGIHWIKGAETNKTIPNFKGSGPKFRNNETNPYIAMVQDGDDGRGIHGRPSFAVIWTDDDGTDRQQAYVDGHELMHLIQGDMQFKDGCENYGHACDSMLDYDFSTTSMPEQLVKRVNERGLYERDDGPWY
jgi:hypothetical protein